MQDLHAGIILATAVLGAFCSARIAWTMGLRWFDCAVSHVFLIIISSALSFVGAASASMGMIELGGTAFGILGLVFCIPAVGAVWALVTGGIIAVERVLKGLDRKLS